MTTFIPPLLPFLVYFNTDIKVKINQINLGLIDAFKNIYKRWQHSKTVTFAYDL